MSENEGKQREVGSDERPDNAPGIKEQFAQTGDSPLDVAAPQDGQAARAAAKPKNEAWEWTKALLIAFALAFLIRHYIFGSYIVDGPSMKPNFQSGERLIVNKLLYDIREPKRGEVIVFHAVENKDFIKRIIALPGDTIKVQGDNVYINGQVLDEPYLKEVVEQAKQAGKTYNDLNLQETKVPEGTVYVLGDNRSDSTDSRMIGPVTFDKIVGRTELVFWPIPDMKLTH
ncbi:MAG: sipS [Paenibacillus sp.]|jgi:signal peptidase I|nr:sipS [Paenibacillus sp.]